MQNPIYKCSICGNVIELLYNGGGQLVCCGQPMDLQKENTVDAATEKHVPIIEKVDGGYLIKVGEVEHPMTNDHYIEWIETEVENEVYKKFLKAGDKPEFLVEEDKEIKTARAYCNIHGLWKNQ